MKTDLGSSVKALQGRSNRMKFIWLNVKLNFALELSAHSIREKVKFAIELVRVFPFCISSLTMH